MSYAQTANRPNPLAAVGALGVPAAFGAVLVIGLAVKVVVADVVPNPDVFDVTLPEPEVLPEPDPVTEAASDAVTPPDTSYTPPPRPQTDYTFDNTATGPITVLTGPGERLGPVEPLELNIPGPAPSPRFDPVAAAPRGNPGGWITDGDYRSSWIARGYSGVASFTLMVDARGRVSGCAITGSTGYPTLDEATCRLLEQRARFDPAKDTSGNATAGTYRSSVRWRIPE